MGRTYRGLSKKDKERLKNGRLQRHKREVHDDEWEQSSRNRREDRSGKVDMDTDSFDDEYYRGYEKRRRPN